MKVLLACEDNLDPQLLIRATRRLSGSLYLLLFKKVRSNRLLNIINLILRSDD